jgi:octaprenyl-diphosphate synthase
MRRSNPTLPLADLYSPIREDLEVVKQRFDDELSGDLPFVAQMCDTIRSYRGKMLRPALLLLTGKACGEIVPAHHTLAAVVEMVHMATLVHDDVLDEADIRRRQPTVSCLNGNTAAVLLGDYLISHSFHLCSELDSQHASRRIGSTTNVVCEGELLQNHYRGSTNVSEAMYLDIIRRKTGVLTATACELGAYCAGTEASTVSAMRAFGEALGIAFQIVDDVLDIVGDAGQVGKTLGQDFALGKLTLPTIHAVANASAAVASQILTSLHRESCDRTELRDLLEHTGSVDYSLSVAGGYIATARRQLEPLPPSEAKSSLTAMADFVLERGF